MDGLTGPVVDPAAASLHILLVEANTKSRQSVEILLHGCNYQVTACKTSQEAIQVLKAQQGPGGAANFDLILKEHCPISGTNATRFLKRALTEPLLQGIPIIVISAVEDRDVMVNCLQLGAADFMLKPLRASELRNIWARVYWWRRATYHQPAGGSQLVSLNDSGSGDSGSAETRGNSDAPQEAALDDGGSGGGSDQLQGISGLPRSTAPSDESKDNPNWSRIQPPSLVSPPQQASNLPSQLFPAQTAAPKISPVSNSRQDLKVDGQHIAPILKPFPPLDLQGRLITAKEKASNDAPNEQLPGFRAYVAEPHRSLKRPLSSRDDPGSSGSDWTGSLEKTDQIKRQAIGNGNMASGFSALTHAILNGQRSQESMSERSQSMPVQAGPIRCRPISAVVKSQKEPENENSIAQQGSAVRQGNQALPPGFPFCFVPGMLPSTFGMPSPFWAAQNIAGMAKEGDSSGGSNQASKAGEQMLAQQAMHQQICLHQNMLLQQFGMAPFLQFPGLANTQNQPQQQQQQGMTKQVSMPVMPTAFAAKAGTLADVPYTQNVHQKLSSARSTTPAGMSNGQAGPSLAETASCADRLDNGRKDSLEHAPSKQVALDGFLLEPSRKQRRAEALHKYKQKRKNLNFTKKIRYESRKQLAQARPRVKGQFVRLSAEDVNAVVDALTPAQMEEVAEGKTDVTDLLLETARNNAELKNGKEASPVTADDTKDVEISDEDGPAVNAEVSSPDLKEGANTKLQAPIVSAAPQCQNGPGPSRRNSSQSGSNSPETENNLLPACV